MEKINSKPAIKADNIILGHRPKEPISESPFSFQIPKGCITALVGANGSGKTTLLLALIGIKPIISGRLSIYDHDVASLSPKIISSLVSILPQDPIYPAELRVKHFLELCFLPKISVLKKLPDIETSEFAKFLPQLNLVSILSKPMKQLSSGERQRVLLARALFQEPKLMLLDEPSHYLDPKANREFWTALLTIRELRSLDILVSTHDLKWVEDQCDWVLALIRGSLFFCGPKTDFYSSGLDQKLY